MAPFILSVLALVAGIILLLWGSLGDGTAVHFALGGASVVSAYFLLSVSL
jgi:hypothetical protein